ncbi:YihY/virulence factor BrkB family protein [Streptomyces europaeiscabiei]|uniref:YihY/virulence factor BrkB family protein n=1 Tax=Streptomyces europaeiscabiei TaxID=146819 RepID=UPI0007660DA6|nr:YihY/virulence factor BrkB family protein [Streptomyces europaeiscabiei]MDX3671532.1 YihY/virulence factor BrkB family protein [Streptomyces europaeiscabiei]MDX3844180.1 YihY/virulence factor BrkB family protein [Streptomyces europaeiscabiei]MDX3859290.1 YihY/virulence factor BrkB family protein [Streptomyces europaeiscabiei]MDX3868408.1 YihY/virulence factor BrkB family protein [Streptomyces europaeiscabiei]
MDEKRPEAERVGKEPESGAETGVKTGKGSGAETGKGSGKGPGTVTEERAGADTPTGLSKRSWWAVVRRTAKEFQDDELSDRAAALTYYGVLSLFPAILVLVSMLGVVGQRATDKILDNIGDLAPGPARDILRDAVVQLGDSGGTGGVLAIVGLLAAVWSASGYVAAFIRTSNAVYDLPEGRPAWKVTPLRIALTLVLMVMLAASALIVVFTGPLAERAGTTIGLGDAAITMWNIAKWPVLLVLVTLMIALLYWAAPNVRGRGFCWVSPGGVLATLIWLAVSAGFAVYAANFGSYNKTYGALAGAVVFLVWLWLTNLAILLGLEFDAELSRERAITEGRSPTDEPYVEPRDTRKWPPRLRALREARARATGEPDTMSRMNRN